MFNIRDDSALAAKLDDLIDKDIDDNTQFRCSHDEWRIITLALRENYLLKITLEHIYGMASEPVVNPLEVGFRHTPLSNKEILERYRDTCKFIADDIYVMLNQMDTPHE